MVYFSFAGEGEGAASMAVLDAVDPDEALDEARERLRGSPGTTETRVFNGDLFVGTVEAPAFGYAGVNATTGLDAPIDVARAEATPHVGDFRV